MRISDNILHTFFYKQHFYKQHFYKQHFYKWHFYKQHFYKQHQTEVGGKIKQELSNIQRLNFCYLKIIHRLHSCYHTKIIGDILKKCAKYKCVRFTEIMWIIKMKMRLKIKK